MFTLAALVTAAFVAARVGGVMMTMPVLTAKGIPKTVRIAVTLLVTALIAPNIPAVESPGSATALVGGMAGEAIIGALIGGNLRIVFSAVSLAGEAMGSRMGHGAAAMFNPMLNTQQGPLGTLAGLLAMSVFLGTNLHLHLLAVVGESFQRLPPGASYRIEPLGLYWLDLVETVVNAGLSMAGPIIVLVFIINAFVAVITRLAPSMNIFFSLGFILTLIAGHVMFFLILPSYIDVAMNLLVDATEQTPILLEMMVGRR